MKKVAIIGHFGGEEIFFDGQTIKTKNLEALLSQQTDLFIKRVDTYYAKKNRVKLLFDTLNALFSCKYIFLLVSVNGMKVFLPLLYYLNHITKRQIYHYIIGSEILEIVEKDPRMIKYLNSLDANWFEYESGTRKLHEFGVKNVITVPNFKNIVPVANATTYNTKKDVFNFCTFSRVMREKGITDAIESISRINERSSKLIKLDVYGPIDPSYKAEFDQLLTSHFDCISYKGCIDSQKSVEILKDYYALLFPTYWDGEGLPGTIIDAFASGLPVIATDWNANKEIIDDMKTGIIYPSDRFRTLNDAIEWAVNNADDFNKMRVECRNQFNRYTPDTILEFILAVMK